MKHYTITQLAATLFIVLSLTGVPMLSSAATAESAQLASILSSLQSILAKLENVLSSRSPVVYAQTAGLVGYWNFDEGTGTTANDMSGHGNTGTLANGPTWTTGKLGQALNFDGSNDFVKVLESPSLDITTNTISFGGWIYPRVDNVYQLIVGKEVPGRQYAIYLVAGIPTAVFTVLKGVDTEGAKVISSPWVVNQWNHIFLTYDGSSVKIYLNGEQVNSHAASVGGNITHVTNDVYIGAEGGSNRTNGLIDDVRIYNRALSVAEVQALYTSTPAPTPTPTPTPTFAPTADIKANNSNGPLSISSGSSATISWTSTNTTSCTVSPLNGTGTSGSQSTGNLSSSQTYTLSCTGTEGTASDSVSINISAPTPTPTPTPTPPPPPLGSYGIAGPDQSMAEGLVVLLGDPAKSGTDPGDTDPGHTYHWRQIVVGSEPYVKLSHIDKTTTMFIAPEVSGDTTFRFGLSRDGGAEDTVDVRVVDLSPDSPSNTTFIDNQITPQTCDNYNPQTRSCGSGTYKAQKTTFLNNFYPLPTPGWRYVWREGTYSYSKTAAGGCRASSDVLVRIQGTNAANGTATNPIQFKVYKNGTTYESALIDMGGVNDCGLHSMFMIAGSSYVIAEGFEVVGSSFPIGGVGVVIGGFAPSWEPSHHVTVRHFDAHDAKGTGAMFSVSGASHEIALQYIHAHHGAGGVGLGVSHEQNKTLLPYNVFVHTASLHDNVISTQGSNGAAFTGSRNSICYRCVAYNNADGGFNTQGPHLDSNVWWDSMAFRQNSATSPNFTGENWGNERGHQIGTIGVPGRAAFANRVYRFISFDNMGNGFNDAGGATDTRASHMTIFNNCRQRRGPYGNAATGYAGVMAESRAGFPAYPQYAPPGLTLVNTASYWNGQQIGCQNSGPYNILLGTGVEPNTTLITNSPIFGGNPMFPVASPPAGNATTPTAESTVTVDTILYTNLGMRMLNSNFGAVTGLTLQPGSPLINAGTFIPGVHCDKADDLGYPANDPNCIHWAGSAPDIGAYEYGITYSVSSASSGPTPALTPPTIDTTAPSVPTALSATAISSSQINLSWTASTDNVEVTGYKIYRSGTQIATVTSGTSYQNTGLAANTTYSYTVSAYDAAGNVSTQSSSVSATTLAPLDITPPILSAITASSITPNSAIITWTTDEPATTQVEYGLTSSYGNSSLFNSTLITSHSVSLSSLSSGSIYHYRVKSQDASSNLATSLDNTFTTSPAPDTTAPNAIINLSSSNIQSTSLTVSWSAPSDLPSGGSTASYDIRYSTSLLTSSNWNTSTQVSGEPAPASPGSSQSYIVAGLNPQTTYYVGIKSQDVAGNISLLSNVVTAITPPIPDTTPPVISSVTVSAVSTSNATITWTTNESSDSQVEYGLTSSYGSSSSLNSSLVTSHSITLSSLASGTLYHYRVKSKDASLNLASSGDFTFTTSVIIPPPDITPPVISAIQATGITSSQATIIWTTNESSDSQVEYGLTAAYGSSTVLDSNQVTSHSVSITNLSRKTTYHYRVKSKDAAGNLAVSGDNIFTTSARNPKPSPVTNLQASQGSVIISWTNPTDYEFFRGVVVIKSATGFSSSYDASNLLANTKGEILADQSVTANTTYYYSVFTYDDLGVYSDPVNVSFMPLAPITTNLPIPTTIGGGSIIPTPVPPPSKVNIYGAKDQVLLTWQNPTDSNFVRVKILRKENSPSILSTDGAVIYEGDGKEFTDTQNLKSNTTYYYTLFSLDRALATSSFYSASVKLGEKTNQEVSEAVLRAAKTEVNLEAIKTNIASIQQSLSDYLNLIKASPEDLSLPAKLSEIQKAILAVIEDLRFLQGASTTKSQFTRAMFFGMRGSDVTALQQILIKEGLLASDKATGYFGFLTREAVKKFQIKYNIVSSGSEQTTGFGLVGKKTRERLGGR